MCFRFLISLFFCFAFFTAAPAQKAWSLQECIDYALKNNITVKQTEISSFAAKDNVLQSMGSMMPSVNGSASHNINYGRSVDPFSYTFTTESVQSDNFSVSTNVTIFNGLELLNSFKKSKLDYMASRYDLAKIKNDIALNVAAAFLQVLYSQENLKAATDRLDAASKQRTRTQALTDAGTLARGSLLDAEALHATEELNKVTAENNLITSKLNLVQLLQIDSASTIEVQDPAISIPDKSSMQQTPVEIFSIALKNLPEIKSAETRTLGAAKGLAIARGGRFPRLSMYGSLSTGYSNQSQRYAGQPVFQGYIPSGAVTSSGEDVLQPFYTYSFEDIPFNNQLDNNYNKSFGFSLSIPVFNGFGTYTNVKRAKWNLENSKLSNELTKDNVYKSIQQAHADAQAAQNRYTAAEKSAVALQEAYIYTEKKYDAGILNSLDFVTAKNNLNKAQSDMLQAKYDFILRLKILDFYSGKPLSF